MLADPPVGSQDSPIVPCTPGASPGTSTRAVRSSRALSRLPRRPGPSWLLGSRLAVFGGGVRRSAMFPDSDTLAAFFSQQPCQATPGAGAAGDFVVARLPQVVGAASPGIPLHLPPDTRTPAPPDRTNSLTSPGAAGSRASDRAWIPVSPAACRSPSCSPAGRQFLPGG